MNKNQKHIIFLRCCFGYSISGMAVLVIGAILPSVIRETNITYGVAGGLLSMMAIGNLLASFFFPILAGKIGKRPAIGIMAALVPFCLLTLTFLPPAGILYLVMLIFGIARGCITIINNNTVNVISGNSGKMMNLLHCSFAIGALLTPFLTSLMITIGLGWRSILYLLVTLCSVSALSYSTMEYDLSSDKPNSSNPVGTGTVSMVSDKSFLKSIDFYCIGFLLFFYLGVENCINGWFVTYLQSTGIMSETYATNMVSVTWTVILIGRLVCAALSQKCSKGFLVLVNAIGSTACFFLLISVSDLILVTAAIAGLGFFLAGIYPTCIAQAGPMMKGSTMGMSVLTAISAIGGIITPQIVGNIADRIGMTPAISLLVLNMGAVFLLAAINFFRSRRLEAQSCSVD